MFRCGGRGWYLSPTRLNEETLIHTEINARRRLKQNYQSLSIYVYSFTIEVTGAM